MSAAAETQGGAGRREVAWRLFATEFDDATLSYSDSDEERAPNYVVTPAGARVNRLFVVGVLTEVETVGDGVLRARVVDPTGAFVVYAGQYQPEAATFLERAEPPTFVAVTGKARTYQPDGSDRVFTSIRPESVNEVDADTRDRWTVQTASQTLDRIEVFAGALDRPERGEDLTRALVGEGVGYGLAAGIPVAMAEYGTTPAYLAALRDVAVDALRLVAGERDEVEPLDVDPDEPGEADLEVTEAPTAATRGGTAATGPEQQEAAGSSGESTEEPTAEGATPTVEADTEGEAAGNGETPEELGDFDDYGDEEPAGPAGEERYELDDEEREQLEAEYGTEFSTGTEIEGAEDVATAEEEETAAGAAEPEEVEEDEEVAEVEEVRETDEVEEPDESEETEAEEAQETDEPEADEGADEVDLEDAAVEAMRSLDEGDGADREAVVAAVAEEHGVSESAAEDAIEDALMSGMCYEPAEGRLKAI